MGKVIIGISGNEQEFPTKSGRTYVTVASELADGVRQAGGVPMVIPMGTPDLAKDYINMIDKLILSGGQHVDPSLYGQERLIDSNDYLLERDEFELALIEEALWQGKPIFAVCRGMQLLNVALGGSLEQEVAHHWQEGIAGTSHRLQVKPKSRIGQLFTQGSPINSFHQQRIKELAPGLVATGLDPRDGTIEAYESRGNQALFGIQWHPEFLYNDCKQHRDLFQYLVDIF
ncbi:gamma-glutamyl-gamma-aminobutyrate hydrolase family protein [Streptococcus suis]|uniref:gamma-glutamyl-gamma-aminobutyrate hydrolase family protein n=1 Tax=Streptococcus suis TaxID=1307 RepID=UPI0003FDB04A|nr:gamma-glutamyl-gamma-aminobutyrate hydrolase family protein [Streptococcus suis]MCK3848578.1 gamma-glutamyl-gamma-aminobutyrate hydrolase family protein [Streptococcus suis]MCK3957934.1 gamma-glutamyl-gamma-aminobutyrate hydrolase family protein [Streptococcus suis]MCK4065593.1 gamma-glutamyl-gamma-aminobutyrate hydrolase family protein [Streptococcus suis]HEM2773378.1 gamma-glutamyl-gamma-aminobutyrate hydrolase family protein [Streptococcus suis]HEM3166320.1 gamma-glutamyl-gamma-aminobuty